jgi:hypothetical protein
MLIPGGKILHLKLILQDGVRYFLLVITKDPINLNYNE